MLGHCGREEVALVKKKLLAGAVFAAVILGASGNAALAQGNPQGQVEQGPQHANSICSFSGLNDTPNAEFPEGGQTQSYGQLVSKFAKLGIHANAEPGRAAPGIGCNAHLYPYPPGPPPPA